MGHVSDPELLVLHAVRLQGMADADSVSDRFTLDRDRVQLALLELEARGLIQTVGFVDMSGWALTDDGRAENERLLGAELEATGARPAVVDAYERFVDLNANLLTTITKWQIRPTSWDPMAANDHTDWGWDDRVLRGLEHLLDRLRPICADLAVCLARLDGYPERFGAALDRANRGESAWVDQPGIDSCHVVWFELHEDLLATLGRQRGQEP